MKTQVYETDKGEIYYLHNNKMYFFGSYHYLLCGGLLNDIITAGDWIESLKETDKETKEKIIRERIDWHTLPYSWVIAEFDGQKVITHIRLMGASGKRYAGIEE